LIGAYFLIAIKNTSSAKFVKPSEVIISVTSIGPLFPCLSFYWPYL
jgi:hypothetical protein